MDDYESNDEFIVPVGGTHGHLYERYVDGDPREEHIDRRLRGNNIGARSNMRDRNNNRSDFIGRLPGTYYGKDRTCAKCNVTKPYLEFLNMAVSFDVRGKNGYNTICRSCNNYAIIAYTRHGYQKDEFVTDDEEVWSDDDEEVWSDDDKKVWSDDDEEVRSDDDKKVWSDDDEEVRSDDDVKVEIKMETMDEDDVIIISDDENTVINISDDDDNNDVVIISKKRKY